MNGIDDEQAEEDKLLDQHINALMEHFDAVQILASRVVDDGGTESVSRGAGNYHARVRLAGIWAKRCDALDIAGETEEQYGV